MSYRLQNVLIDLLAKCCHDNIKNCFVSSFYDQIPHTAVEWDSYLM